MPQRSGVEMLRVICTTIVKEHDGYRKDLASIRDDNLQKVQDMTESSTARRCEKIAARPQPHGLGEHTGQALIG